MISEILSSVYVLEWENIKILECGANKYGEETSGLKNISECWYMEPNPNDYNILKNTHKNTINLALSNNNGKIKFNVCHGDGSGLSGINFSEDHLNDIKILGVQYDEIEVEAIRYDDLQKKYNVIFDILVLDVEGHECNILNTFFEIDQKLLPKIIVIECGHDWKKRLEILNKLEYFENCYYYNNCYLIRKDVNIEMNENQINIFNNQWRIFKWGEKIIYENNL